MLLRSFPLEVLKTFMMVSKHAHIHTFKYTYIYIYIYTYSIACGYTYICMDILVT